MRELAKLLDIKEEEQGAVLLLLIHSFFIGIFLSSFFSVANGAFLRSFDAKWLPIAYIASGVTGYAISSVFSSLQKKISYRWLLLGVLLTLLALMVFFVLSLMSGAVEWIAFVMFVWVGPFYSLIALQFWSMAMKMFDLRQAKRLFGLLGTGDVLSSLIGFSSVPFILSLFKDGGGEVALLLLGIVGLVLGIVFQLRIFTLFSEQLGGKKSGNAGGKKESMKEVLQNKYFLLIFIVTFCSVLGQYFVDYNFMSLSRSTFKKSELTFFIGSFFAIIKLIEFIAKTFVAARLLKSYGLSFGLTLLPILLFIFTTLAVVLKVLDASAMLIFVPLAMNKLFDRSLRKAIDDPSMKVMYQPLDPETKLSVQTHAEGKAKQIGIVVAGGILILFSYIPNFNVLYTAFVLLLVLGAWVYYANRMYQRYRMIIKDKLVSDTHHRHKNNKFAIFFLKEQLGANHPERITVALNLAERLEPSSLSEYWIPLLDHPSIEVRKVAMGLIQKNFYLQALPALRERAKWELEEEPQQLLAETIDVLETLQKINENDVFDLARSTNEFNQITAAAWLSHFEHPKRLFLLKELAADKNIKVAAAAIQASASVKSVELWSVMIDYLSVAGIGNISVPALVAEGEALVPMLDVAFSRLEDKPLSLLKIIQICGRIGGEQSQTLLIDKINYPNREVQLLTAEMLILSVYKADEKNTIIIKQLIFDECDHICWLLACYSDIKNSSIDFEYFLSLLAKSYETARNHILKLTALIYDADSIERIDQNLNKGTKEGVTLALEMIDILIEDDIKDIISLVVERTDFQSKYLLLSQEFPQIHFSKPEGRLKNILYQDFSKVSRWLKASAIAHLMEITPDILHREVNALAFSDDFFLKEMALVGIYRVDPNLYNHYTLREKRRAKVKYDRVTGYNRALARIPSNYNEVLLMRQNGFLHTVPENLLVKLSEFAEQESMKAGEQPSYKYRKGNNIHFMIEGEVTMEFEGKQTIHLLGGEAVGLWEDIDMENCLFTVHKDSKVFYLNKEVFYAIAQVHFELVKAVFNYLTKDIKQEKEDSVEEAFEEIAMTATVS